MTEHWHPSDAYPVSAAAHLTARQLTHNFEREIVRRQSLEGLCGALELLACEAIARARFLERELERQARSPRPAAHPSTVPPREGMRAVSAVQEFDARENTRPLGNVIRLPIRNGAA